jgi:hypothetical protein
MSRYIGRLPSSISVASFNICATGAAAFEGSALAAAIVSSRAMPLATFVVVAACVGADCETYVLDGLGFDFLSFREVAGLAVFNENRRAFCESAEVLMAAVLRGGVHNLHDEQIREVANRKPDIFCMIKVNVATRYN